MKLHREVSMVRTLGTIVGLVVFAGGLLADDPKAKAKPDKTSGKEMTATVVKVDAAKNTIRIKTADGKQTDLMVDDQTQFVGPRGGVSKDGIKDDRLHVGAQLKVTMDGKTVKEIHLPYRNIRERREAGSRLPAAKDAKPADTKPPSKDDKSSKDKQRHVGQ